MGKKKNKRRVCNPLMCDNCMYIGKGDCVCKKYLVLVVDEWEPTDGYMKCEQGEKR